jgi:hypothetical protein
VCPRATRPCRERNEHWLIRLSIQRRVTNSFVIADAFRLIGGPWPGNRTEYLHSSCLGAHVPAAFGNQTSLLDRVNPELVSRLYILENISYEFVKVRN